MRPGLVVVLAALAGCGYVKEYSPIRTNVAPVRVPNQQRLVALSATQAVTNAARELNLAQYAGKAGIVEVNGVFPHSAHDLGDYVGSALESEMARAGMRVIPHPTSSPVRPENGGEPLVMITPNAAEQPQPDVRVVASLDWGGIDLRDQQYYLWKKGITQWGITAGLLITGLALVVDGTVNGTTTTGAFGAKTTSPNVAEASVGGILLIGGFAVGAWAILKPAYAHQFTITGRVRITLRAIPVAAGIVPAQGTGEAEAHIVIDSATESGYSTEFLLPQTTQH